MRVRAAAIWLAAGLAFCIAAGCADREASLVAAQVDGRAIPLELLRRAIETRLESEPAAPLEEVASEELERLVDERVALNRAEALGVQVLPGEVEARILLVHGENFELRDAAYDEQVRQQMMVERTALRDLAGGLQVSDEDLLEQFRRNQAAYGQPERIQIRQIVVSDAGKARELRAQLATGADFVALARENSLAPEAKEGGLLPAFAIGELPEVFDQAFSLKVGQTSEVLESPHGYHIFVLVEKIPAREAEFASVREKLLGDLQRQRLAELRKTWIRDLRRLAKIEVNERLLEDLK
jgi:peptidyl-prolyl cis-trans isomerase C